MLNPNDYHLPSNSYWVCNSTYNGLSKIDNFERNSGTAIKHNMAVNTLHNRKISARIHSTLSHSNQTKV